ncbi:MAG: flagellin [Acidovorax sp.]|nr:MAG: flagellin [Acidovorax sp.]
MAATINTNISSLTAQRNLGTSQASLNTAIQRLSSGLRINSAKDDAAGLAISERFTSQIRGLNQAVRNANDGISLAQVAQQFQVGANANQTIVAATGNLRTSVYGNNQNVASNGSGIGAQAPVSGTTAVTNGVTAGSVAISGYLGTGTLTVASSATAKATADQINALQATTGVTATARSEVRLGGMASAGSYSLTLEGDNIGAARTVSFTLTSATGTDRLSPAVSAINEQSAKTGINASLSSDGTQIILTNATGNDVVIGDTVNANAAAVTVTGYDAAGASNGTARTLTSDSTAESVSTGGYITIDSEKSFAVTSASNQLDNGGSSLHNVANLDVTTFTNATDALKTVDSALAFISGERAKLGAMQSRFETSIASLQITSENLSASRSRIQDADFAAETANLSRAQILQQAGTAMVAQANQIPQGVLSLLK